MKTGVVETFLLKYQSSVKIDLVDGSSINNIPVSFDQIHTNPGRRTSFDQIHTNPGVQSHESIPGGYPTTDSSQVCTEIFTCFLNYIHTCNSNIVFVPLNELEGSCAPGLSSLL